MFGITNDKTRAAQAVVTDLNRLGATLPPAIAETVKAAADSKAAFTALIEKGSSDAFGAVLRLSSCPASRF